MRDGVGWDLGDDRVFKTYFGKGISETGFWTQRGVGEKRRSRDELRACPGLVQEPAKCGLWATSSLAPAFVQPMIPKWFLHFKKWFKKTQPKQREYMAETICGHRGPAEPETLSIWPITEKSWLTSELVGYGAIY